MSRSYVYVMRMRPPGPGCQPKDGLIETSSLPIPFHGIPSWGTARYNRALTEEEEKNFEMEYLGVFEDKEN